MSVATHAPAIRPTAPIARTRATRLSGIKPVATDKWLHYDQVGSVMMATNASAAVADTRHADAFGNEMSSWSTGAWTDSLAERTGWGHNTKELDGDTGLVYMYQRWYLPEAGIFVSMAPLPPMMESQYGFVVNRPATVFDAEGLSPATAAHSSSIASYNRAKAKMALAVMRCSGPGVPWCGTRSAEQCQCLQRELSGDPDVKKHCSVWQAHEWSWVILKPSKWWGGSKYNYEDRLFGSMHSQCQYQCDANALDGRGKNIFISGTTDRTSGPIIHNGDEYGNPKMPYI